MQRESVKQVDARADVCALGVLSYRMIIGKLPSGRYAVPEVRVPALRKALNQVILTALTEAPAGRYADALLSAFQRGLCKRSYPAVYPL
ncbi:hypothetical protein A9Q89_03630 [Gammaproteobacteria bacterium 53_120_T64]|nr:hypothetical protein A9Q89_03630 [Gammaproteobacteria bacterium 53_120_T64]